MMFCYYLFQGKISLDGYSKLIHSATGLQDQIVTVEQINNLNRVQCKIPDIDYTSKLYQLVSVEGIYLFDYS